MSRRYILPAVIVLAIGGLFFFTFSQKNSVEISTIKPGATSTMVVLTDSSSASSTLLQKQAKEATYEDIENQTPLSNPPAIIKAVYATAYSIGSPKKRQYFVDLIKNTELNAIMIDIKDYSGYVLYDTKNPEVLQNKTKEVRIVKINAAIKEFHDAGIYVIARQTVFQDPALAKSRPDLAVKSKKNGGLWHDYKGLAWIDPSSEEVWKYNLSIAQDAKTRGFDEINFDYIRFASDGNLADMQFSSYDGKTPKHLIIKSFFKFMSERLTGIKTSADLFGLVTVVNGDLGIGQVLEDAAQYFDYIAPMIYPSHFASGFAGYKNPAAYPGEVVTESLEKALLKFAPLKKKTVATTTATTTQVANEATTTPQITYRAKLRPWLQDFNLGATYDATKVRAQITATETILGNSNRYAGWMIWNASNVYTKAALSPE